MGDSSDIVLLDSFSFTIFGTICGLIVVSSQKSFPRPEIENKLVLIIHATFNKCLVINQKKASEEWVSREAVDMLSRRENQFCVDASCVPYDAFVMIFQNLIYISAFSEIKHKAFRQNSM